MVGLDRNLDKQYLQTKKNAFDGRNTTMIIIKHINFSKNNHRITL